MATPTVNLEKAKSFIVAYNHSKDPNYAPYCLRCAGIDTRMSIVEPFFWKHHCGALHDERQVLEAGQTLDVMSI